MKNSRKKGDTTPTHGKRKAKQSIDSFEGAIASNPVRDPQDVAHAFVNLISTLAGELQFRTVVEKMGLGDAVVP